MKVHTVVLSKGDAMYVQFEDMDAIDLRMSYEHILEAALQVKLQELHKAKYAEQGLNSATVGQQLGAPIQKW